MNERAVIEGNVEFGDDVKVEPFAVIRGDVVLEDGVRVCSHAIIEGKVHVGANTVIGSFSSVGTPPQDKNFKGGVSAGVVIGKGVVIREYVSINASTDREIPTIIEDGVLLLAGSHVAHDSVVRKGVIVTNNVMIAGHVEIGEGAVLGGGCAIHQKRVVGAYAMVGGLSGVRKHLLPFSLFFGLENGRVYGINKVGMTRNGFTKEEISAVHKFFALLKKTGSKKELLGEMEEHFSDFPRLRAIFGDFFCKVGTEPFHVFSG